MHFTQKSLLVLAACGFGIALGFTLYILSCALYSDWWPLLAGGSILLVVPPLLVLLKATHKLLSDWALFTTTAMAACSIGIIVIFLQYGIVGWQSIVLLLSGLVVHVITLIVYVVFFKRRDDDFI